MTPVERETIRQQLVGRVCVAARKLRDASRNLLYDDADALDAWNALNKALQEKDDWFALHAGGE